MQTRNILYFFIKLLIAAGIGKQRRPSMDSFSEDESITPESKRRVRMIHRH